ncbi:MAG: peptidyl-prolyl cis-trans isomerase [Bacteroidetes bacterium]|nr:peptidyl-prolyl cis-trans isomerase [Bacteroidota bacterium]
MNSKRSIRSWAGLSIYLTIIVLVLVGCELFKIKENQETQVVEKPVARVFNKYLYKNDLRGITPKGTTVSDSIKRVNLYLKNWIKKQLMISEASSQIEFDEADIERKVSDYRYALMVYEYQKYHVNKNLEKDVTDEEIELYYKKNLDNFQLKQNIIKGTFIKISKEAPRLRHLNRLIQSKSEKDKIKLKDYCFQFANSYILEDSLWINFDEVIKNTPMVGIPNKVQFLRNNKNFQTSDEKFHYYINIYDYKISDEISPLEFVRDDIENIIINKRKISLANQLEEDIYEGAQKNNDFEIYKSN